MYLSFPPCLLLAYQIFRLKWKPPSENSIDFKLVLRFPPSRYNPGEPDWHAKPVFLLYAWCGDAGGKPQYEEYDDMHVSDEKWEE
jgi:mRNA guanylyltransferase